MTDQELDPLLSQAAPMARDLWLSSLPGDGEQIYRICFTD